MTLEEIRLACRSRIETLEMWLRRLIDDELSCAHGSGYFEHIDQKGNRLISQKIVDKLDERVRTNERRFARKIDATLLEEATDIVCNPTLYKYFRPALAHAFPLGHEEARIFLRRLHDPRNRLSHGNAISIRQAEQVICYTNDTIDSMKKYYREKGMVQEFNVPRFSRLSDSFGNVTYGGQPFVNATGAGLLRFDEDERFFLRPGDRLVLEVEVDATFDQNDYEIFWIADGVQRQSGPKFSIDIAARHVGLQFSIFCTLRSHKEWHRLAGGRDDSWTVQYRVLPPI